MKRYIIILFLLMVLSGAYFEKPVKIDFDNPHIFYNGRIDTLENAVVFYWPGTLARVSFRSSGIKVKMKDNNGKNYYNIILDGNYFGIFKPDTVEKWITLAVDLKDTIHTVEVFRRADAGPSWLYAFEVKAGGDFIYHPEKPERTIEFYGNSITVGASIHDYSGNDLNDSTSTDNYMAYGALTARHYNANYYCIARGGIGLMVSLSPQIMPEIWNRTNQDDPGSKWDFSKVSPDVVVINLFQNDAPLVNMPDNPQFKARFGDAPPSEEFIVNAYVDFLKNIRTVYPDASIICTLGMMSATKEDKPWRGYIKQAVQNMEDPKIYSLFFPYKGNFTHPLVEEQKQMADSLIRFIDDNIIW